MTEIMSLFREPLFLAARRTGNQFTSSASFNSRMDFSAANSRALAVNSSATPYMKSCALRARPARSRSRTGATPFGAIAL
jgi:hypothetical protein